MQDSSRAVVAGAVLTLSNLEQSRQWRATSNSAGAYLVNLVHRSGTRAFHGVGYEFLRNNILDANGFFDNRNGKEKAAFRYNQFGFTLGGPLTRSRETTFFFVNYEGIRQVEPGSSTLTIPTSRMKSGDFGEIAAAVYDPLTIDAKNERRPFSLNAIPAARFDPVAVKSLADYPEPNRGGTSNNFYSQAGSRTASDNLTAKIDRRVSERQNLFGRFSSRRPWLVPVLCPLGAISNLAHRLGARRGWLATNFRAHDCKDCSPVECPAGAIGPDGAVNRSLCMNCYECTHSCVSGAYECSSPNGRALIAMLQRNAGRLA